MKYAQIILWIAIFIILAVLTTTFLKPTKDFKLPDPINTEMTDHSDETPAATANATSYR